jgi:hypothetical protein
MRGFEHDGDQLVIRVNTRNGSGNREDFRWAIESMQSHPWFRRDADGEFDDTYADFWFAIPLTEVPPELADVLVVLAQAPVDVDGRLRAAIDAIGNEEIAP